MPKRRDLITLTPSEQRSFLEKGKTIYLATNGKDGYPQLLAMWYAMEDGNVVMTTYRKSQKVLNLRRDPRCSLLLEEGATYDQLKGVLLRGECEILDDEEYTLNTLGRIGARAAGSDQPAPAEALEAMRHQARKRVVLRFRPARTTTWDHAKLGGVY